MVWFLKKNLLLSRNWSRESFSLEAFLCENHLHTPCGIKDGGFFYALSLLIVFVGPCFSCCMHYQYFDYLSTFDITYMNELGVIDIITTQIYYIDLKTTSQFSDVWCRNIYMGLQNSNSIRSMSRVITKQGRAEIGDQNNNIKDRGRVCVHAFIWVRVYTFCDRLHMYRASQKTMSSIVFNNECGFL
jgi:hypothetical protein